MSEPFEPFGGPDMWGCPHGYGPWETRSMALTCGCDECRYRYEVTRFDEANKCWLQAGRYASRETAERNADEIKLAGNQSRVRLIATADQRAALFVGRDCSYCGSKVVPDASRCEYCGAEYQPWRVEDGSWWEFDSTGQWTRLDPKTWMTDDFLLD